ncbi:hypothetical protein [Xanthomonas translucens]|uniref:hypothetical protein n=1 Tax=Xanthomonas campestris pv. translucens TaxID=343 RepID=UPI00076261C8|nr:hypothetical protein ATB54_15375 [Xanthomonas translucens]MQS41505.1 hypothetical protein [Xanthomonas translucens pv. translucens]UKE56712.1 hypothetical protein KFS86_11165 [Xanthomonas translucens pv. hordei]OAX63726.1 hypothetical protein A6R79_05370 [Xanthomonas translucens pv. translucens]QSQ39156.1 hypothetical protein ISN32_06935 [Xanthomonas translucens pv. translucens]
MARARQSARHAENRDDASRANLIELIAHLATPYVYDNSSPADRDGQVTALLVLGMDQSGVHNPLSAEEFEHVQEWAKPIVMAALEARPSWPRASDRHDVRAHSRTLQLHGIGVVVVKFWWTRG